MAGEPEGEEGEERLNYLRWQESCLEAKPWIRDGLGSQDLDQRREYLLHFSSALSLSNMLSSILRSKETATYAKAFKPAKRSR